VHRCILTSIGALRVQTIPLSVHLHGPVPFPVLFPVPFFYPCSRCILVHPLPCSEYSSLAVSPLLFLLRYFDKSPFVGCAVHVKRGLSTGEEPIPLLINQVCLGLYFILCLCFHWFVVLCLGVCLYLFPSLLPLYLSRPIPYHASGVSDRSRSINEKESAINKGG
jgi:hypothetical protein